MPIDYFRAPYKPGDLSWKDEAACIGEPLEHFFAEAWEFDGRAEYESELPGMATCRGCPVREPCLEWALANHMHGVLGGTTTHERELMRRAPRRFGRAVAL